MSQPLLFAPLRLRAARPFGCDDNDDLWPPEYGWWLNKRKANLPGDPSAMAAITV